MSKKQIISKTSIQRVLKQSALDPRQGGPIKLVIDNNMDDPSYLEKKAIELIQEGQFAIKDQSITGLSVYTERIEKAIFLLAVARLIREFK